MLPLRLLLLLPLAFVVAADDKVFNALCRCSKSQNEVYCNPKGPKFNMEARKVVLNSEWCRVITGLFMPTKKTIIYHKPLFHAKKMMTQTDDSRMIFLYNTVSTTIVDFIKEFRSYALQGKKVLFAMEINPKHRQAFYKTYNSEKQAEINGTWDLGRFIKDNETFDTGFAYFSGKKLGAKFAWIDHPGMYEKGWRDANPNLNAELIFMAHSTVSAYSNILRIDLALAELKNLFPNIFTIHTEIRNRYMACRVQQEMKKTEYDYVVVYNGGAHTDAVMELLENELSEQECGDLKTAFQRIEKHTYPLETWSTDDFQKVNCYPGDPVTSFNSIKKTKSEGKTEFKRREAEEPLSLWDRLLTTYLPA